MNIPYTRFFFQFRTWARMLVGSSYWHIPLPLGEFFVPGEISGYYLDMRKKVHYPGPTDSQGIPLMSVLSRKDYYHPTMLLHKALGHWDLWIEQNRTGPHLDLFLNLARK